MYVVLALSCAFAVALADVSASHRSVELPLDYDISLLRAHPRYIMTPNGPVPHPRKADKRSTVKSTSKVPAEVAAKAPFDDKNVLLPGAVPEPTTEHEMTLQEEVAYLRERLDVVREDIDEWMNVPRHRNVELPIILGAAAGMMVIVLYKLLTFVFRLIMTMRSRGKNSRLSLSTSVEKKNLLSKKKNRKRTGSEDSFGDVTI